MHSKYTRRGTTLADMVASLVVVAMFVLMFSPSGGAFFATAGMGMQDARSTSQQLKDMTQIRGIHQAFVIWANNNDDVYPLPSQIDVEDATVAAVGTAKDTTANILSVLNQMGSVSTELLVSSAEVNEQIEIDEDYEYDMPRAAVNPQLALWDPAFSCDFRDGKVGNVSFAHLPPTGKRLRQWQDTYSSTEAVIGNRGPEVSRLDEAGRAVFAREDSNTFRIHGPRDTWEGGIAYNDNHVSFAESVTPAGVTYATGEEVRPDVLFYDEPDDVNTNNAYLSIWPVAGAQLSEFVGIWD